MRLRIDTQTHVAVISPPRKGKSAWLARVINHYPGPVVSTTTKADIFGLTSGLRSRRGPIHVFSPQNIGYVPSTFRWNPIEGCQDAATAIRRADMFSQSVSQKGVDDGTFWSQMAGEWLRAMFQAAALAGLSMLHVQAWTLTGNAQQAENILAAHGRYEAAASLAQMKFDAKKTTQTIQMTLARSLAFLADPMLAASVLPAEGDGLDIEEFLHSGGTLYMIAESRNQESPLAPLFACLANEIHYTAALIGSQSDGGRLDPSLLMALDEVTQICPIPLPSWLADSGGKGIQIIAVCHGEAQLRSRWGSDGARVIFDTSGVKLYLPGITDPDTLSTASKLCGQTAYREHGEAEKYSRHDVMTIDMVSRLPKWRALALQGGHAPVIVKLGRAWKDPAYRLAKFQGRAIAVVTAAAEPPAINRPVFGAMPAADPAAIEPEAADSTSPAEVPAEAPELEPAAAETNGASYPWRR
jgi:type IV secretory pathway TraG/TraD family ATPase VirD4